MQIVGKAWNKVAGLRAGKKGERKVDQMVKKLLSEFYNETLDKVANAVVVAKKKQTLNRKNDDHSKTN